MDMVAIYWARWEILCVEQGLLLFLFLGQAGVGLLEESGLWCLINIQERVLIRQLYI